MRFYFAPMEGLTGHVYRKNHHAFYGRVDKYFSPFLSATSREAFKPREQQDILPENNRDIALVPQLMTNNPVDFIHASERIRSLGYDEINLNLGCPSGTVVAKNKGAGFLALKEELEAFLEAIFSAGVTRISVKTRIGKDHPEEFAALLALYNQYPMTELIIHPRTQRDQYGNKPNLDVFRETVAGARMPVCYNGDLFCRADYEAFVAAFPTVGAVMLGRGLVTHPGLINAITNGTPLGKERLMAFHDQLYADYRAAIPGERNVLFRMKELWTYMLDLFPDHAKHAKSIRKAERLVDYEAAVAALFRDREPVGYRGSIIVPLDEAY